MKAIEHKITGIKCDAPECNWIDNEAEFEPEKWLNAPCPDCGANLFTQEAWNQMKAMQKMIDAINDMAEKTGLVDPEDKRVWLKMMHNEKGLINGVQVVGVENDQ